MKKQQLMQINSQILQLAMQQDDLNSVLGSMLSTAECLSNRFGQKVQKSYFEAYNLFGSGNRKNEKDLKDQLKIQTKIFRNNYKYMLNEKGKYPFPKNFGEKEIKNIVNIWKSNSKPENVIYYDNIINILNKNLDIVYPGDNRHSNGLDPNFILDVFPNIINKVDQERDNVRNNVIKNGSYDNNLKLEGKSNMVYPNRNSPTKSENDFNNLINQFDNIFKYIECYLYLNTKKTKKPIKTLFGNIDEYEKMLLIPDFYKFINDKLIQFENIYKEFCEYYDLSNNKIINDYETIAYNWDLNFKGNYYLKKLFNIIQIRYKNF